ncbi:Uncharacterized conserved protein [Pseudonocardia thermophila]|uniref:Uncharacterized conserved protein n=1 Tax=Pseudonocardia thermophila TaxID=1848 RepID=A0A1M6SJL1_PSETH|nr:saccharopine dehydrogenase NADP-binding domain-containing protein [Pseudonocardia thermophila]SHK44836.1 Uncharacterized conserved protein [Pseudonocardia thermophila]
MTDREHDIVVFGATGFVGELVAAYLADHAPAGTRFALAGRSPGKLAAVRDRLPAAAREWPLITADATDAATLAGLAASARVVVTTVGPYAKHGMPLVEACAAAGTHYADLTGEVLFVRAAADKTDAAARATGARIVHSCGYDSIPSDIGVLLLHERAAADDAGGLIEVQLVATARGGFSGGTIDTARGQLDAIRTDRAAREIAFDPYGLSPDRAGEPEIEQPPDAPRPARLPDGTWTVPFMMAGYNTRIVRRSNALLGWAYGRDLRYGEVMGCGTGLKGLATAAAVMGGMGLIAGGLALPPTRALLDRVLPAPGTGPSEEARRRGWFRDVLHARTESGRRYRGVVAGRGDPGYAATAVMLGESALALALDTDRLPDRAGSLTPATGIGSVLAERLRAAGHTYTVEPA